VSGAAIPSAPGKARAAGWTIALVLACSALGTNAAAAAGQSEGILKVCADPANLPLSNDKGEGYENKIAEALAHDLKLRVEYTYFPQRMGFVRHTLRLKDEQTQQYACDLIIGVPKEYDLTATTIPYMRSTYALVFPDRSEFKDVHTAEDLLKLPRDRLDALRIGIFTRSPGADWVLKNKLMEHAGVYSHQNGDVEESPARTMGRDLDNGKLDAAIVWGPIAGMMVDQRVKEPKWRAVPFEPDPTIRFDYEISMGVRNGEKQWKDTLDAWISSHKTQIDAILTGYKVPLIDAAGHISFNATDGKP
jgi:quinoprotein dehydrogenase-associated probable ABC transporter substrate-binding protein